MASAQQLIGLVKSHAEGNEERFFDLAMQLAAAEQQKGHKRLADQLRQWAEAGQKSVTTGKSVNPILINTPRGVLADLLQASYPTVRLADIILPVQTKNSLESLVKEMHHSAQLEEKGLRPRHKILLAGVPGTGKTLTAAGLAGQLHFPLFKVLLHGLITKYMGETAQKLSAVFEAIRTTRGIYLFDEIDALAAMRSNQNDVGEARRILNSFLQFLDEDCGPSLVIATTNLPEILDPAILRRFDLVLFYEVPDDNAVRETLRRRLIEFNTDTVEWKKIAKEAQGLSTADIIAIAEDAARAAVLSASDMIETEALQAAVNRRRDLQRIGEKLNGKKSAASSAGKSKRGSKTL